MSLMYFFIVFIDEPRNSAPSDAFCHPSNAPMFEIIHIADNIHDTSLNY